MILIEEINCYVAYTENVSRVRIETGNMDEKDDWDLTIKGLLRELKRSFRYAGDTRL